MPVLVYWILAGIASAAASWLARIIFSFGLVVVAYDVALPPLRSFIAGYVSGMPATAFQMFSFMGIDKGLTLILSALVVSAAARVALAKKGS